MAFDQTTRNRLQRFVTDARDALSLEFTRQLQSEYGMDPKDGTVTPLENLRHLDDASRETARLLRDTLDHYLAASPSADRREALDRIVREQAFTVLNRLAALRMAEARGILTESVSKGYDSKGFQLYLMLAGTGHGETGDAYRSFLFSIFDEFALDLNVLFDRFSPQGRLFPREAALLELLGLMNDPEVAPLWGEDETIGWIYQYFNSKEERKKMRDESAAPRNSRELAVRNQFFTPRYVVEFLTDNTLGRIWYEMTRGETRLKDQCRYLVRRPTEIFLGDPREAAKRFGFEYIAEHVPPSVRAAYRGDFAAATTEEINMNRWWIALAIPPDQFEKVTGLPLGQLHDYPHLERIWEALDKEPSLPLLKDPASVLSAFCEFVLTSSGGPYAVEPTERLWEAFKAAVARQPEENLSQEELLRRPVFVPHRPLKDPRSLRVLDPACGSMHFGLYAYDLLEVIYEEAWELEKGMGASDFEREAGQSPLRDTYADKETFLRDVPRLIIEHNLHGIDIDPRAVQIAGLSLWLRAQRAWATRGVKPTERPQVRRSNIVCAEPMPGEETLLKEFVDKNLAATPELRLLGQLVRHIFNAMKLAGEAGSLLKIETEIANAVTDAKQKWTEAPTLKQDSLFAEMARPEQPRLGFEVAGITDEAFWEQAEKLIYEALQSYAEKSENGGGYQRRLFADDAARGFAFIDLCRKRYDVMLMNPPFGKCSEGSIDYFETVYSDFKSDIGIAFVNRFIHLANSNGCVGAITSRTFLASDSFEEWRAKYLLDKTPISSFLDLGYGVLDGALVEAAAYVIDALPELKGPRLFIRVLESREKERSVKRFFESQTYGNDLLFFFHDLVNFKDVPLTVICYWLPQSLLRKLQQVPTLSASGGAARHGLVTTDDYRFLRLTWEVAVESMKANSTSHWKLLAKGGEYQPFWDDLHICVDWSGNGRNLKTFLAEKRLKTQGSADWSPWLNHSEYYGIEGLTYPERTTSDFCPRALPRDVIFSSTGQAIQFEDTPELAYSYLCGSFTRFFKLVVESFVGSGDNAFPGSAAKHYRSGLLNQLPSPLLEISKEVQQIALDGIAFTKSLFSQDETARNYCPQPRSHSLREMARQVQTALFKSAIQVIRSNVIVERLVAKHFDLTNEEIAVLDEIIGPHPQDYSEHTTVSIQEVTELWTKNVSEIIEVCIQKHGPRRQLTKKSFIADRKLELLCHALTLPPEAVTRLIEEDDCLDPETIRKTAPEEVSFLLGSVLGRWDIRFVTGEMPAPELPDPFAPLPVCPPGMLQNEVGLPAKPSDVPENYPLRISWSGIIVDDPGHAEDIEERAREALQVIWSERADAIEQEACEILGVRSFREYFRKPNSFFADHLSRYSKSRRQAPIYWPLATPSGSYTLWLYYHRLDAQTLYRCVVDFVEPKLRQTNDSLGQLRAKANRGRDEEREMEHLQDFVLELQAFRDELLRLAQLPWRPDLNDGVQITAAPLWKLFRLPKWQKTLKETWQNLEKGEYDWAHLAMTVWPERVVPKCVKDRSLAIAHGLEDLFWVEDADGWRTLRRPEHEIEEQKKRQSSDARARAHLLLAKLAASDEGDLSADEVRSRLAGEEWNDREAALLLYPERVAEACWENPNVARRLNIQLPAKHSAAARQQFTKKLIKAGCPDVAEKLESALRDRTEPFRALWEEMERGDHDDFEVAVAFWPERVIDKCTEDAHLAERHGVRQFLWCQHPTEEWRRREDPDTEVVNEVARRRGAGRTT